LWDEKKQKIVVSRDVDFFEQQEKPKKTNETKDDDDLSEEEIGPEEDEREVEEVGDTPDTSGK